MEPVDTLETRSLPSIWNTEIFSDYLHGMERGRNILLPVEQYPAQIDIGKGLHETMNQMRVLTKADGREHLAIVGIKPGTRAVYTHKLAVPGMNSFVPSQIIEQEREKAKRAGIILIGDLHSHPYEKNRIQQFLSEVDGAFSAADFYSLLYDPYKNNPLNFMGLVDGNKNIFMFRAKDTDSSSITTNFSQEDFERYWYENSGYEYLGNVKYYGGEKAKAGIFARSGRSINKSIAQRHKLAIYYGNQNEPLRRFYP